MKIKIGKLYDYICKYKNIIGEYNKEIDVSDLKMKIPNEKGLTNIKYIIKKKADGLRLLFENNKELICANNHILYKNNKDIYAKDLKVGDVIDTKTGVIKIIKIEDSDIKDYYDICVDYPHIYYDDNGIKHHNTLISLALAKAVLPYGKFIIIEPSTDLTLQTRDFYKNLGFKCGIVGMGLREFDNDIIVCTWQTLLSLERRGKSKKANNKDILSLEDLEQLKKDTVAVTFDESHLVSATEIFKILSDMFKEIPLRWGLTGTVPKGKEDYYPLICALGAVVVNVDSKELQDKGILADSNITILSMVDKEKFEEYDDEFKYLTTNPDKIMFEAKIIAQASTAGNTLVLVQRLETGRKLVQVLNEMLGIDAVFLSGKDKSDIRMEQYKEMQESNNKIIIATSQIASTGLDIPRIFNMIYIDMGKSFVKTIQSIGRGLRTFTDKTKVQVFDICSSTKFSKKHMKERIKYYIEKEHPWQIINIEQWKDTDGSK